MKTYTGMITKLADNQVFVFGSNLDGFHGAGAAGFASFGEVGNVWRKHRYAEKQVGWKGKWNVKGIGVGFQEGREGRSYAIPTVQKIGRKRSITLEEIRRSVEKLYAFARDNPDWEFLVAYSKTRMLSGYSASEIAGVFKGNIPENIVFEVGFARLVEKVA